MRGEPTKSALKYTLWIILFATLISEAMALLILYQTKTPYTTLILLDSALLVAMLLPVLYVFVYRPLHTFIGEIGKLNREKDKVIEELEIALNELKTLKGIIPICASCKKIRDDEGYWNQIETYITARSEADFSHGICPDCAEKLYPEFYSKDRSPSKDQ